METNPNPNDFEVRVYTQKELANKLGLSTRTLRRYGKMWDLGEKPGRLYTPRQVKIIIEKLGKPIVVLLTLAFKFIMGEATGNHNNGHK